MRATFVPLIERGKAAGKAVSRFVTGANANVAIMFALMTPLLLGGLGVGAETTLWYVNQRNMQNASDAAALAAATDASSNYANVADAVAAQYGYTNGANGATVAVSNTVSCPSGGSNCYSVNISFKQPLYLLPAFGFQGNTTVNSSPAQSLQAAAIAQPGTVTHNYCLLTLSTTGTSLRTNGAPKANLAGCNVMSNSGADCNGHDLSADFGDAAGTNNGCGVSETSNVPTVTDPYASLASNIPANPCASYPQEGSGKKGSPSTNATWSGTGTSPTSSAGGIVSTTVSGGNTTIIVCGDLQLTGDTVINTAGNTTIVIENGQLDTGSYKLSTANGSTANIVFSGTSGSYTHAPTGGGTLDIQAPTSGAWSGVAVYQDPSLTTGVDISAAGNSPTWDISGLVYLPNSNVTFSGAVGKSDNGAACFVLVTYTLLINGTANILNDMGQCAQAGLGMPSNQIPGRGKLVG